MSDDPLAPLLDAMREALTGDAAVVAATKWRDLGVAPTVEHAFSAAEPRLRKMLEALLRCGLCEGTGLIDDNERSCFRCDGSGLDIQSIQAAQAEQRVVFPHCDRCGSSAWMCSVCVPARPALTVERLAEALRPELSPLTPIPVTPWQAKEIAARVLVRLGEEGT